MPNQLNPVEQEGLLRDAGGVLLSAAPQGWRELELSFRSTVAVDTSTSSAPRKAGNRSDWRRLPAHCACSANCAKACTSTARARGSQHA